MPDQFSREPKNSFSQQEAEGTQQQQLRLAEIPWDQYELVPRKKHNIVCRVLMAIGSIFTFIRNLFFNVIFILLILAIGGLYSLVSNFNEEDLSLALFSPSVINNPRAEVVYFNLKGPISEIPFSMDPINSLQRDIETMLNGSQSHELISIEKALEFVAKDKHITKIILNLDEMSPLSLSMVNRIGDAIDKVKANGSTEVIAVGAFYSQAAYALAAHADHVVLDPLGEIDLKGISLASLYFKDLLENAKVTPYVFRAGHFKSAVEPFVLNGMSFDVREEYQKLAQKNWRLYEQGLRIRENLKNKPVLPEATTYIQWMQKFNGDRAQLQLHQGLVDEVTPLSTYFQKLAQQVPADSQNPDIPAMINYQDYLYLQNMHAQQHSDSIVETATTALPNKHVAVIYGIGEIIDTPQQPTDFSPDNIVPLLNKAKFDDSIVAVVLYINSPGGSVTASEQIRRAVAQFKESGKPLVISMNDTAASGGYWIASEGDTIFATPSTLTGSIGVFGLTFGVHKLLNHFGAYEDGVSTHEFAEAGFGKAKPDSQSALLQLEIQKTYKNFISLVAKNRNLDPALYKLYAEGQVFIAEDALKLGLIDNIGSLQDAINTATEAANLSVNNVSVLHVAPGSYEDLGFLENFLLQSSLTFMPIEISQMLVELKQRSRLMNLKSDRPAILALSPLSEAKL